MKKPLEVIAPALEALGLSFDHVRVQAGLRHRKLSYLAHGKVTIADWFAICDALLLDVESLISGFDERDQKRRLWIQWNLGLLEVPRTKAIKKILQEEQRSRRTGFFESYQFLGHRLRIKQLRQEIIEGVCAVFWRNFNQSLLFLMKWNRLSNLHWYLKVDITAKPFFFESRWHRLRYLLERQALISEELETEPDNLRGLTTAVSDEGASVTHCRPSFPDAR